MSAEDNKFLTADGKEIVFTQEKRKHLQAHPDVLEFIEEAISKVRIPDGLSRFEEAISLKRTIGMTLLVQTKPINPDDETDFALRVEREWPVRVFLESEGEPCDSVTIEIIFYQKSKKYFLNTAYIGFPCPDSPYHISDKTGDAYKEALQFWCSHALAYDPKIMGKPFKASWKSI